MKKKSNEDKVIYILLQQGYIDNYYCVDTRLTLRLSDIIFHLKNKGWKFDEDKSGYINSKQPKNWYYIVSFCPFKKVIYTVGDKRIETYTR